MALKASVPCLTKLHNVEDEATGDAFVGFKVRKTCNRTGTVFVPREEADDVSALFKMFKRKNVDLPVDKAGAEKVIRRAINSEPIKNVLRLRHVGWQKNLKTFVLGRKVIGAIGGELQLKPPLWIDDHSARLFQKHGTLVLWKRNVALPAQYSDVLRLAILASAAASLVRVIGWQNFAINIFGPSKAGKTTALLASTSFYGIGVELNLPNWNSTAAAFMEEARGYNDLVLPGNEVGLIEGKKRDAYSVIRSRIYTFAEGRDRSRMSRASISTPKYSATYRGIALYTAEYSFEDYAAFAGETRSQGEYARAIDVPAVTADQKTIFCRYPGNVALPERQAWARKQVIALRRACSTQCGTAIRPYVNYLMKVERKLPKLVHSNVEVFMKRVEELDLDPALDHAAKNFGLLYAAGCLGIDAEVLPWKKANTLEAVLRCFREAVGVIKRQQGALDFAKQTLKVRLQTEKIPALTQKTRFGTDDVVGFRCDKNGKTVFTIHSAGFRGWFDSKIQCAAILRWLLDEGYLTRSKKTSKPSSTTTEWAERSPRWPDGSSQKSFVFKQPFADSTRG